MKSKGKNKLPKARENAGEHVAAGFTLAFDWLRNWREFSRPITEQSEATALQS